MTQAPYGYDVPDGYMGWVPRFNKMMKFSCYRDYIDYIKD